MIDGCVNSGLRSRQSELPYIQEAFVQAVQSGATIAELQEMFHISQRCVYKYKRALGFGRTHENKKQRYYTVYLRKDDSLIVCGTSADCAKFLGCSKQGFYKMVCNVKKGRNRKYDIMVDDLEEDER